MEKIAAFELALVELIKKSVLSAIAAALAAILCPAADAALNAPNVFRADSPFNAAFPIDGHVRVDGTLLDAVNLGAVDSGLFVNAGLPPNVDFAAAQGPNPSGANWSAVGPASPPIWRATRASTDSFSPRSTAGTRSA